MNIDKKPTSIHQNERNTFRVTPLKPLRHSNSVHRTSAGLKSKASGDEMPVINDFYLSDLSTSKRFLNQKQHLNEMKQLLNVEDFVQSTKNFKIYELFPSSLREFLYPKKEFMQILDNFDRITYCLDSISEKIKCYRPEMGNLLDKTQQGYCNILEKVLKSTMDLFMESEQKLKTQVTILLDRISDLEAEKKELQGKNHNLKSLYNFQESEYKICKMNSDSLQTELVLLHELLKKDIHSFISHVTVIEDVNRQSANTQDLSEKLNNLNDLIINLEDEQNNKKNVIDSMNNLLKAMLKGGKNDMETQVNEVELLWKADMVIESDPKKVVRIPSMPEIEGSCLNFDKAEMSSKDLTNLELVRIKEKQVNVDFEEKEKEKLNVWNLPATLMVFLENVLKNQESGRVLPWIHFRKIIYAIYSERVNLQQEVRGCFINNTIPLDEFLCIYFMKMHKVRRIAEIKLLEFLISLKYYAKIWPRALLFANLCNIIPYTKPMQENLPCVYDLFLQEYFLFCFSRVVNTENSFLLELNEGQTILKREKLEDVAKDLVFFSPDAEKRKFILKISKTMKKVDLSEGNSFEGSDIDKIFEYAIEEYFEMKRRNFKALSKKFGKYYENENGLISYDEFKTILNELGDLTSPMQKYGYSNEIIKLKTYLYSITSGKNKNDIAHRDFNAAVIKFGIDCPFPLILTHAKKYVMETNFEEKKENGENKENLARINKSPKGGEDVVLEKSEKSNNSSFVVEKRNANLNSIAPADNSAFFGQHFTILRELKTYCNQFKEAVGTENDIQTLMKHFDNISRIIEMACQFLSFPVKY